MLARQMAKAYAAFDRVRNPGYSLFSVSDFSALRTEQHTQRKGKYRSAESSTRSGVYHRTIPASGLVALNSPTQHTNFTLNDVI